MNIIYLLGFIIIAAFMLLFPIMVVVAAYHYLYLWGWVGVGIATTIALIWYASIWLMIRWNYPRKKH